MVSQILQVYFGNLYLLKIHFSNYANSLLLESPSLGKEEAVMLNCVAHLSAGEPLSRGRTKLQLPVRQQRKTGDGRDGWSDSSMFCTIHNRSGVKHHCSVLIVLVLPD